MAKTPIKNLKPTQKEISQVMIDRVKDGIKKGDKFEPVAVLRGHIINGHHRAEAHKQEGFKTVDTKQASSSEVLKAIKKKVKVAKGGNVGKENG